MKLYRNMNKKEKYVFKECLERSESFLDWFYKKYAIELYNYTPINKNKALLAYIRYKEKQGYYWNSHNWYELIKP